MAQRLALLPFVLACLTASAVADGDEARSEATIDRLIEVWSDEQRATDHLDVLTNRIGARLTASDRDIQACEWARDTLEDYGLSNVRMEEAGQFDVAFNRGPWFGKVTKPEEMVLEFGTPAWSAGTKGATTGRATLAPTELEDAEAEDYAGTWVLMEARRGRQPREEREKQREINRFLGEAGVAGFVYATRDKYIRTGGNSRLKWDDLPATPRINLRRDQWDAIEAMLDAGETVEIQFDIRNHFEKGPAKFYNVIGEIPGTEKPNEIVVIGGHIDSWDGATGTTDNGCGVAVAMEAARLLMEAGAQPKRTIQFHLWSGEEQGLLGSKAWVDQNPGLHDKISACYVYDGGPNAIAGIDATPAMMDDFRKVFAPVMELDMPFEINERPAGLVSGGSDHSSFLAKNIPGFFWTQKGRADWRHGIHTQYDTFDLAIPEYLEHSALVVAMTAIGTANLDGLLSREKLRARRGRGGGGRRMGVFLEENTITTVNPNTVAAKAGLKAGDVIVQIDTKKISSRNDLVAAIRTGGPKKKVKVKRGDAMVELEFIWENELKAEKEKKKKKERIF